MRIDGEVSLRKVADGDISVAVNSDAEIVSDIIIGGEIVLENENDGDIALVVQTDGIDGLVYTIETGLPDPYDGEYIVTPKVTAQTLETAHKYMWDDVTIKKIPAYDVSNDAGGRTFYIADDLED